MAKMYKTIVREQPDFANAQLYHGKITNYDIHPGNFAQLEDCSLWYMQIVDRNNVMSYFLGALDFDIARPEEYNDAQYAQLKQDRLTIIEHLLKTLHSHYQIFDSGNKGYHAYVYSSECWRVPEDPRVDHKTWVCCQLKELYGVSLYDMMDLSNHFIGKGLRPYCVAHPKTGRMPSLVRSTVPDGYYFWDWFYNDIINQGLEPVKCRVTYQPLSPTTAPTVNNVTLTIDRQEGGNLMQKLARLYRADIQLKVGDMYLPKDTKWCCFLKSEHKSQKNYILMIGEHAMIQCHSGKCKGLKHYVSKDYLPLTDFGDLLTQHCTIDQKPTRRRVLAKQQDYISKEDIEWCLAEKGYGAVFAPMGSGKTQALESWLKDKPASFTCLLIVVRKTQATYFASRYGDFVDYQKQRASLHGVPRLVVCINSLIRLLDDGLIPKYDLLILDEIESILEAAVSKILSSGRSEQTNVWNILATLIKSSDNTLIMDGIPTHHTIAYFSGLNLMREFSIVEHHKQPDFRVYQAHCDQAEFVESINHDMQAGKNVVLVTNTKEVQSYIYNQVVVDSKLMINADSIKKVKNTTKKPNEKWNVRFLAYNNAVGAGQSFDLSHFHSMYAVVSAVSCSPQSFYQLICRIRKLKESVVNLLVIQSDHPQPVSKEELKMQKLKNIVKFHSKQDEFVPRLTLYRSLPTENIRLDICDVDYKILRVLSAERLLKLKHEDDFFINMLVDYEHEKLGLRDSAVYTEAFFEMIHRNGGVVIPLKESQQNQLRASTQKLKVDARKESLDNGVNVTNQFWKPDKVLPHVAKVWNERVGLADLNTHYRWLQLRNRLLDDPARIYEKEFTSITTRGKAASNCMLYSNGVLDAFTQLSRICGFEIDRTVGMFRGTCSIVNFYIEQDNILRACRTIFDQLYNETGTAIGIKKPTKETNSALNLSLYKNIEKVFKKFGIRLDYHASGGSRKRVNGQRMVNSRFSFCELTQHIRLAVSDIEYDTGEKAIDGVAYFIGKANKYF
jgi:hypothetical protein